MQGISALLRILTVAYCVHNYQNMLTVLLFSLVTMMHYVVNITISEKITQSFIYEVP